MKKKLIILALFVINITNAQKFVKLGGQIGWEKFMRSPDITLLDSVQLSYSNSGDGSIFGGIFGEFPLKDKISFEYALNFFQDYNSTRKRILRNNLEQIHITTISYWAIHNSFSLNYYLVSKLYLTGGLSFQINVSTYKFEFPYTRATLQYSEGLDLTHQAIRMNRAIWGGIVGIGYEIGRLRLQTRFQKNFSSLNHRTVNPWGKVYQIADKSFNLFVGVGLVLFKK